MSGYVDPRTGKFISNDYSSMMAGRAAAEAAAREASLDKTKENETTKAHEVATAIQNESLKNSNQQLTQDQIQEARKKGEEKAQEDLEKSKEEVKKKFEKIEGEIQEFPVDEKNEKPVIEDGLLEEYGNNFFQLTTYDKDLSEKDTEKGGRLKLAGVLKEVPAFSMTATWEKGPASSISDTVKGFMCSSLMEMVNTLGGHDRSWMNLDEGTDRTYASTNRPTFDLTFRIYTTENIGSHALTTWKTWLTSLSLYAMPSISNKVNINEMGQNVVNSIVGIYDRLGTSLKASFDSFKSDNDKDLMEKVSGAIGSFADTSIKQIQSRDGLERVRSKANTENFYGAKLWYLNILPGIFEKPLIVYISNWSITYSKELNMNNEDNPEPLWVEFKINCEMDQIASAKVWMDYLSKENLFENKDESK